MLGYSLQMRFGWSNNEYYFSQFPVLQVQGTVEHTSLINHNQYRFLDVTISVSLDDAVFLRFIESFFQSHLSKSTQNSSGSRGCGTGLRTLTLSPPIPLRLYTLPY